MTAPLVPIPLRRGAVVQLGNPAASGDPQRRLAVVVQADRWLGDHPSLTCCPLTTRMLEAPLLRLPLEPSAANGLSRRAQLMVDKLFTASRPQVRALLGLLQGEELARLERALRQWLELA
jgi:mRNA interferase MazF